MAYSGSIASVEFLQIVDSTERHTVQGIWFLMHQFTGNIWPVFPNNLRFLITKLYFLKSHSTGYHLLMRTSRNGYFLLEVTGDCCPAPHSSCWSDPHATSRRLDWIHGRYFWIVSPEMNFSVIVHHIHFFVELGYWNNATLWWNRRLPGRKRRNWLQMWFPFFFFFFFLQHFLPNIFW